MTAGAPARMCKQTRTKKWSRRRDGGRSVRNCHLERTVSSLSLRRLRQWEHRLSLSVSRQSLIKTAFQKRHAFARAATSRKPLSKLPECKERGIWWRCDRCTSRSTAKRRTRKEFRVRDHRRQGIHRSTLDDDQTGLTFIAKSLPSSCRRCVVACDGMAVIRLALRHPNFPVPPPLPPRALLTSTTLARSIALTRLDGPADARTRTDMPTPSSLRPSFASAQTTCC